MNSPLYVWVVNQGFDGPASPLEGPGGKGTKPGPTKGGKMAKIGTAAAGAASFAGRAVPLVLGTNVLDAMAEGSGLYGGKPIDEKQDEENWKKMNAWQTVESSLALGIETVGGLVAPGMANEARAARIRDETEYFKKEQLEKQAEKEKAEKEKSKKEKEKTSEQHSFFDVIKNLTASLEQLNKNTSVVASNTGRTNQKLGGLTGNFWNS
jgi:hypothetical protein